MDTDNLLQAIKKLRQEAVEALCEDEELGRYFMALESLKKLEGVAAKEDEESSSEAPST